ncbi:PRC-barrel domain-containing protein [Bosea lupini]|uniref:PRC-barrel domain-containing protein n=1 Tax=Bosea lupini TaxID=1036779 RepID=A0A1H7WGB8_9HYPH|nr:PRC-barrel domain-containing protein [Bosea lupini]SEM20551.1 PRC-barrel domain-containing protein [Bosea lupini]
MAHTRQSRIAETDLIGVALEGATVYGPGEEKIGSISDVHGEGRGALAVVEVGGFLGFGAMPVALQMDELVFKRDEGGNVHAVTSWTKGQLTAVPERTGP